MEGLRKKEGWRKKKNRDMGMENGPKEQPLSGWTKRR